MPEIRFECGDCGNSFRLDGGPNYEEITKCSCGSWYALAVTKLVSPEA